jgi:toxin YoeB
LYWHKADKKLVKRINDLIKQIAKAPRIGAGKPETLKHALSGYWSRRINAEHRIVYRVADDISAHQLRYHY